MLVREGALGGSRGASAGRLMSPQGRPTTPGEPLLAGTAAAAAEERVERALFRGGQRAMSERDAAQHLIVTAVEVDAQPRVLHAFMPLGGMVRARVDNTHDADESGNFYVEFYVTGKDEPHATHGKVMCGARVLVVNLPPRSTAVVETDVSARVPPGVASGEGRVWAGVRPFPVKELRVDSLLGVQRAAATGERAAMMHLGDAHWHGQGGAQQDVREAMRWYAACGGSARESGADLLNPAGAEVTLMLVGPLPADLAPLSLERGLPRAWLAYALRLDAIGEEALGEPQNLPLVQQVLSKWECDLLGERAGEAAPWAVPNRGVAASWMHHAAARGDMAQAQLNLGVWYALGRNLPRSLPQAWLWYRRAAAHGLRDAQYNLGLLYQAGGAVDKDPREAAALFQLAVEQGHVRAHLSLGACYLDGVGAERDLPRALQLFAVPAARGEAEAQYNLAVLYHRGHGTARDAAQAAAWFLAAADQGHREAQVAYAMALYKASPAPPRPAPPRPARGALVECGLSGRFGGRGAGGRRGAGPRGGRRAVPGGRHARARAGAVQRGGDVPARGGRGGGPRARSGVVGAGERAGALAGAARARSASRGARRGGARGARGAARADGAARAALARGV